MTNDEEFFAQVKTMDTEELLLILENDDPGQRNINLLTPQEGFLYTDLFINNDFEALAEMNKLIEERRLKLLEIYKSSLH